MFSLKERLKEILIKNQIIKQEDLDRALQVQKEQGGELSKILVKLGLITEEELTLILSQGLGMPPIDIARLKIDPAVVKIIPRDVAINYQILPVSKIGDSLTLAMADPLNIFAIDNVRALTGLEINPIIGRTKDILQAIDNYYSEDTQTRFEKIIRDISDIESLELVRESAQGEVIEDIESLTQDAPTIKLTNAIIEQGIAARASDVFVEPLEKVLRIRYRIDGVIREVDRMPKNLHFPIVSRIKVICNMDISEHRLPQDGRFKIVLGESKKEVDFRVSVLPAAFGENVVIRILDKTSATLDIEKLGFGEASLKALEDSSQKPHGMILACGPTGSGKTTTLYSILNYINSPEKNIITVEDPIEYQMQGMNQVSVRPDVGLTFSAALRSILRQDPDIIMIGEIRDYETLDIAIKSALTGHLVLSSLHTTTASGSIVRMVNMGVEPFLICSSVLCILAQRLLRKLCDRCKEPYQATEAILKKTTLDRYVDKKEVTLYKPKGCRHCLNIGYSGRIGISEVLVLSPKVKPLIMASERENKIKEMGRREGMITMREDGFSKVLKGLTSLEEVLRVTTPDDIIK
ncbi:MAG: ATPase, T2SS/T4P/T4SS family [Candidatus Omnitrophota bacterium]